MEGDSMEETSTGSVFDAFIGTIHDLSRFEYIARQSGLYPVHVCGWQCRTFVELFSQFAAAFQFPGYFGYNLDALYECLCDFFDEDLRYESLATGLELIVWDANLVLADEPDREGREPPLYVLVSILQSVARELAAPTGIRVGYEPVSRGFRVILHFDDEAAAGDIDRWERAGSGPIARVTSG